MKKLTVGSLFSGVGLCDLGFSWAGMRHAFFVRSIRFVVLSWQSTGRTYPYITM